MQRRRITFDNKYLESHKISNNHLYPSGYILTFFIDSRERLSCDAKVPRKKKTAMRESSVLKKLTEKHKNTINTPAVF